ncbi:TonB family protein [Marispirochaeta aestuarii]|uniref:energy transducer TonB n=1 Tax=Marispirochaeta aestuarii TaxID=1963862 RepID=UPI0029C626FD|nr:TonB family protein [Marispirochaeta aestuarii]
MTGDQKRMGAAIAASALINLFFLISIALSPGGSPAEPPGIDRSSPLRVGLLPSVSRGARLPGEVSGEPDAASAGEEKKQNTLKALRAEPVLQESVRPENLQLSSPAEADRAEADGGGEKDFFADTPYSPDRGSAGSEASEESLHDLRSRFLVYLQNEIAVRQEYPLRARRRGTEGTVVLSLQVLADGSLHSYRLERSSGSSSLDRAAEKLITGIFPSTLSPGKDISCTVAVEYRLN